MIYNLTQYLIINLAAIDFIANGWNPDSSKNSIMIRETGGDVKHFYNRTDWTVQILSRAEEVNIAKENIDNVYNLLKNKYGVLLPEVIVNSKTYLAVKTYQISPLQSPEYLGADEKHLELFSFNIIVTTT